jgi:hypothetical protein
MNHDEGRLSQGLSALNLPLDSAISTGSLTARSDGTMSILTNCFFKVSENTIFPIAQQPHFSELTDFERTELAKYQFVYYLGASRRDKKNAFRSGFDDRHGKYALLKHDHIVFRYEILKLLGTGTFASVCCILPKKLLLLLLLLLL